MRSIAIAALVVALAGCGSSKPPKPAELPEQGKLSFIGTARAAKCTNNIRMIYAAFWMQNGEARQGKFLPSLQSLVDRKIIGSGDVLICPEDETPHTPGYSSYQTVFDLTEKQIPTTILETNHILVWDSAPRHAGSRCVGYCGGEVRLVPEEEFQTRLRELASFLRNTQ